MRVKSLSGKVSSWPLGQYLGKERVDSSKLHVRTREFLREVYPTIPILEEVYVIDEKLYLDFFIPLLKTAVESQGGQHLKDNRHFFPSKLDFYKAQGRDRRKAEWCVLNSITLLYFYEDETEEEWKNKMGIQ